MTDTHPSLRLNVGFIIHETLGYVRDFEFELPSMRLSDELEVTEFTATARLSRTQNGILVEMEASAFAPAECARCLDKFTQIISTKFTDLYAFKESNTTDSELIIPENGIIDFTPLITDFLSISIPLNPICRDDCAGLCPICGVNHNLAECDCEVDPIDPRFSVLKDLLDNQDD